MPSRGIRLAAPLAAVVLAFSGLAFSMAWSVPEAHAAGAADAQAGDLVRLINGERAYLGKAALRVDSYLAAKARDGAVSCPNDSSLVMYGRAKDFAVYRYLSHSLRLCTQYTSIDALKSWGYKSSRGEVIASNRGYGTAAVAYTYGCSPSVRTCPGSATSTYYTTDRVMTGWMSSTDHFPILVGGYDRVGCGAWVGSDGGFSYSCLFSRGGRVGGGGGGGSTATGPVNPTQPPESPATPQAEATESLLPWATPSGASGLLLIPGGTSAVEGEATGGTAAGGRLGGRSNDSGIPAGVMLAVAVGTVAAALAVGRAAQLRLRRRRGGASGPRAG